METSLFDYELPEDRIARHAPAERDGARLLVLERSGVRHDGVKSFADLVPEGALVVLNDTRVIKARIQGMRSGSGGKVELLLLRRLGERGTVELWEALGRANRPLRPGARIEVEGLSAEVVDRTSTELVVRVRGAPSVEAALEAHGHVPLPPYMRRKDEPEDASRYQTVFARASGSVAAPTASLHLTDRAIARLRERGVDVVFVTLHIGLGTFRPVTATDLDEHAMHAEDVVVGQDAVDAIQAARQRGAPIVAVGTTVVRALESAKDPGDPRRVLPFSGPTRLLIQPGYSFGPVDALLTNFHMPRSTLLALVSAFAGRERVLDAYAVALSCGYRFLSYGDAMWIPERLA